MIDYDLDFLQEIFLDEFPVYRGTYDTILLELKKFLSLPFDNEPILITSKAVERLLRTFKQYVMQYQNFCNDVYGRGYLHCTQVSEVHQLIDGARNFYDLYSYSYGFPPSIWFEAINEAGFEKLLKDGNLGSIKVTYPRAYVHLQ